MFDPELLLCASARIMAAEESCVCVDGDWNFRVAEQCIWAAAVSSCECLCCNPALNMFLRKHHGVNSD